MRKNRNYWSKENCMQEALKYITRSEFKLNSPSAYISARKNGLLDEICQHMTKLGNKVKRCIYSYEFSDNYVYVGLTSNIAKRNIWRRNNKNDAVTKHMLKTNLTPIFKQLTDYVEINEASELEGIFLENYLKNNWLTLNTAKTGSIGGNILIWDKNKCLEVALKYSHKNEFRLGNRSAYHASIKNGWHDEICKHMKRPKRKIIWTFNMCKEEASKYLTKKEFMKNSGSAYQSSIKNGWHDEICKHMYKLPYNIIYWNKETCALAAKKCCTRTEFAKKYGGAYYRSLKNKWLNEFFTKN